VHACNPEPGKAWSYQMLHLDADWLRCLRLESGMAAGEPLAPARITRSPALYRQFCALNELLFSKVSPLEKEAALVAFIGDHDLSTLPTLPPAPALAPSMLGELVACLDEQGLAELSLDHLARQAGLGRYQLIRAFAAATGMTPHSYLLNARSTRRGCCCARAVRWQKWPIGWGSPTRATSSGCSRPMPG
jgi:AraC-like DNA-binding protein